MKILFAASEDAWGGFLNRVKKILPGHEFIAEGRFEITDLSGIDVLIPTMSRVTEETLKTADKLQLIQQCGAGLELVDINAARKRGIFVANVPTDVSGNADSVAELAIYLMIGLSRNTEMMKDSLKNRIMGGPMGLSLKGRTVGIVGLGGIGKALVHRLRPFGVKLIGVKQSKPVQAQKDLCLDWVGGPDDLDILLRQSDYVVLCLPLNDASQGLINHDTFKIMKPGVFLINVSRGGLVDYKALKSALKSKVIAGAGLDVFWEEPPDPEDDMFQYNVMATPHIGGATDVSMQGIAKLVAKNINFIANGKTPVNQMGKA
ncbi:2-hydroxyacid dehydrogenase [Desulfobacula phenolica]|nr:2-hydroxyacid dehydrogenase [Desulfobacula phenolica]SDU27601.1 Phosphoglycerate dehydrogenase [Desulfobacula phenolica]